jgi:hypothetical protein
MWESENESHVAGERGLVPVGEGGSSGRHDALKNDGFVRRDQSWYVLCYYKQVFTSLVCKSRYVFLFKLSNFSRLLSAFLFFLDFESRYVNSDIPSDLLLKVGGVSFHLHKVVC